MDEQEYHDLLADRFKQHLITGMNKSLKRQIRLAIHDFCAHVPSKDARILDAGCHVGFALRRLRQLGYVQAEGLDYMPLLVRAAKRKNCKVQEADVHNLHIYENDVFDAVFSRYTLEHCHTASKALQELVRVLKPGGIIYIVVSSEIEGGSTQQGLTVFKLVEDFTTLIPNNLDSIVCKTNKTFMGWYDIIYVGKKR